MKKPVRTIETPEVRRDQILRSALRVFSKKGIQKASVNDVVRDAGISKGLVYLYFKGKDALIEAVMQRLFAPDLKRARRLIEATGSARGRLLEYARSIAVDAERYRKLLPLLFEYYSMLGRNKKLRAITANYYRQQEDLLRRLVQQGMKSGEFSDAVDPETVAVSLLALQEGFILRWMMEPDTTDWPAQAEQAVNLQLSSITVITESCV